MTTTLDRAAPDVLGAEPLPDWQRPRPHRLAWVRRRVLRPVVIIPLVVVIAAATWWVVHSSSSSTGQPASAQQVVAATSGTMRQTVSTSGTLAPADTENLTFSTSGQVTAVNVKAGQQVTKGAVLATIDGAGRLWASLRAGRPGFLQGIDEQTLQIGGYGHPDDPLLAD